jgi:hypothetical protein
MYKVPEQYRVQDPRLPFHQSADLCPDFGAFMLPPKIGNRRLVAIASNGSGWEHVSVSVRQGNKVPTPTWEEMAYVKSIFWDDEDCVIQLHPPRSVYVNNFNCLHLWRATDIEFPLPPSIFVGFTDAQLREDPELNRRIERTVNADTVSNIR